MASPKTFMSAEALKIARSPRAQPLMVIDCSWFLPTDPTDAAAAYRSAHIPGAHFFDINVIKDAQNPLPHMLPTLNEMTQHLSAFGLTQDHAIVLYEQGALFSAPRAWWMLRCFGLPSRILAGGLSAWQKAGSPVESVIPETVPSQLSLTYYPEHLIGCAGVKAALSDGRTTVIDARPVARYAGTAAEPRPGVRSGHVPDSVNMPYTLFIGKDGALKNAEDLRALFKEAGVDLAKPIITMCGSGVTAAIVALALHELDHADWKLYDGSWAEWGARSDCPVSSAAA